MSKYGQYFPNANEHYSTRLRRKIGDLRSDKMLANQALQELRQYLTSEKFHSDRTVQVADVLLRLEAISSHLYAD